MVFRSDLNITIGKKNNIRLDLYFLLFEKYWSESLCLFQISIANPITVKNISNETGTAMKYHFLNVHMYKETETLRAQSWFRTSIEIANFLVSRFPKGIISPTFGN